MSRILVSVLLLTVLFCACESKRHGRKGRGQNQLPFLKDVSKQGKKEFYKIMKQGNGTILQQKEEQLQWAEKYNVSDVYSEFEANMTTRKNTVEQGVADLISVLPATLAEFKKLTNNENQTVKELTKALNEMTKNKTEAAETLFYMTSLVERKHRKERKNKKNGKNQDGVEGSGMSDGNGKTGGRSLKWN